METAALKQQVDDLTDHLGDYADSFLKLTLVNATEKGSTIASASITTLVLCAIGLFALFFAGFGAGWWLGNLIDSRAGGFMIIAAFYALLCVIGFMVRKKMIYPYLRNSIISKVYE